MKTTDYVKKYQLNVSDQFSHERFAIDFGNDFMSRLEVYRTFGSWSEATFWKLYDEMDQKWESINNKTAGILPEKLWRYMRREIFIPSLENEFPYIKADKDLIDASNIEQIKTYLKGKMDDTRRHHIILSYSVDDMAIEWDHKYTENALGDLNYKPNHSFMKVRDWTYEVNRHVIHYAFDQLQYQLQKFAAAKAKIQFRIYMEDKARNKNKRKAFDWWDFILGHGTSMRNKVTINEYIPYLNILKITVTKAEELTEELIKTTYRKLSMLHHPDKGGNQEKFIELTEAKNKCIEFVKFNS